jgi:hypothetical protein
MLRESHLYLGYCDQHLYAKNKQAEIVQQGLGSTVLSAAWMQKEL